MRTAQLSYAARQALPFSTMSRTCAVRRTVAAVHNCISGAGGVSSSIFVRVVTVGAGATVEHAANIIRHGKIQ